MVSYASQPWPISPKVTDSITCRARDNPFPPLVRIQMRHLIICTPKLEAKDRLKVLTLQHDPALEPIAQIDGMGERCFAHDLVDARGEYEAEILDPVSGSRLQDGGLKHQDIR
jgi:hypothetical protein